MYYPRTAKHVDYLTPLRVICLVIVYHQNSGRPNQSIHRLPQLTRKSNRLKFTRTNTELRCGKALRNIYKNIPKSISLLTVGYAQEARECIKHIQSYSHKLFGVHSKIQTIQESSRPRAHTCPPPSTSQSPCAHPSSCPQQQPRSQCPPRAQQ
jgi:hypothetical protein